MRNNCLLFVLCFFFFAVGSSWGADEKPIPADKAPVSQEPGEAKEPAPKVPADENKFVPVKKNYYGIANVEVDETIAKARDLDKPRGMFIDYVLPGGPGEKAGLQWGDVVLAIGGKAIADRSEFAREIHQAETGKPIDWEIWRDGKRATMSMVPEPLPKLSDDELLLNVLLQSDVEQAKKTLEEKGKKGVALAWYLIARLYESGKLKGKDEDLLACMEKAAELGFAPAQHAMGATFYQGDKVKKDLKKAVDWFRKAAEQNHAGAMVMLAHTIETEKEFAALDAEAFKWFEKAAHQGLGDAQYSIAVRYALGKGVAQDRIEALKWYLIAEKSDVPHDEDLKDNTEKVVAVLKTTLDKESLAEAEKRATHFLPQLNYRDYTHLVQEINSRLPDE